jgi:hypothetical protein
VSEYNNNDFNLDLIAGIFTEQDRILAEEGQEALEEQIDYDLMTVGVAYMELEAAGYTDAQIQAEIHMRMYTDQGFTHISFE